MQKQKHELNLKYKKSMDKVYLIHVSCLKIPAVTYKQFIKILKNPRRKIIKEFVIDELKNLHHPIGNKVYKLDLTTILYEACDLDEVVVGPDCYYVNIKLFFKYK